MIDGGPLRTSRPTGRQAQTTYRAEPVRYQREESVQAEPVMQAEPSRHVQQYRQEEQPELPRAPRAPRNLSWVKWVLLVIAIAAIGTLGWLFWPRSNSSVAATIDADKYQAVFLSNGQVYFGKLTIVNNDFMKLTNVFYLERQLTTGTEDAAKQESTDQQATNGDNNFQLLKYSDVLYGSEDAMIISKSDIIRYENLRSDGVVAKAIANRR